MSDLDEILSLRQQLCEARNALTPFARFADMIDSDPAARPTGDPCPLTLDYGRINDGRIASLGDCRRARNLLKGE